MATTRIFLVRHGSTVISAEDRFGGSTDVELCGEGHVDDKGRARDADRAR